MGGINLFVYAKVNPVNVFDPFGLATIVIDPGHGINTGKGVVDPGAIGPNKSYEKDAALTLAKAIGGELKKLGHTIIYTRSGDITEKHDQLQYRIDISNKANADYFISVHLNSSLNNKMNYFMVAYCSSKGKALASCIADSVKEKGFKGYTKFEAEEHTYEVLTKTNAIAVLIEAGFISNPENTKILNDPSFLEQIVKGIVKVIK